MHRSILTLVVVMGTAKAAFAVVPQQINHQGVVNVNGNRFNGSGTFRFAIVDPDTGLNLWTNDGTNEGSMGLPTGGVVVAVETGVYSVALGDTALANMTSVPNAVFDDSNAALRIWFDDGINGNQQLSPDHALTSAPYAYRLPNLHVDGTGKVGIGTGVPTESLEVVGNILASGSITQGSSRALKEGIQPLTSDDAVDAVMQLAPMTYRYKADRRMDNHVGFIAEDVPELLATPDRRGIAPMDVVALLTRVVQHQQDLLNEKDCQIRDLADRLAEIEAKLSGTTAP